jgi:hypothetical protein
MKSCTLLGVVAAMGLLSYSTVRAASSCSTFGPSPDPDQNYKNIIDCLSSERAAHLSSGAFPISHKIKMPEHAMLSGSPGTVIKAVDGQTGYKDNSIIELTGEDVVKDITLVGDGRLQTSCCTTVVAITGSGSKIENADISDEEASRRAPKTESTRVAGLYFLGAPDSRDNLGSHLKIHGLNFGVIFRKGLPASANNRVVDSEIFDLSCDSFSFAGGGIAEGNRLHDTGFDCKQRPVPIPGGGFYALNNNEPVVIARNTMTDICGAGFDIVGAENFTITGNKFEQRNAPLRGRYGYCNGFPAKFVDVSNFTVTNNVFYVLDAPPLRQAFKYFPQFRHANAGVYSLTPNSEGQIYAVRLLRQSKGVINNRFANNKMIAECSPGGQCAGGGVGLFVGPGAGGAPPNTFVGNTIVGTSVAAVLCDKGLYEGNRFCRSEAACSSAAEAQGSAGLSQSGNACITH